MALFMVLGWLFPRVEGKSYITKDAILNLVNGALLFLFRLTAVAWVAGYFEVGLVDMSFLGPGWLQVLVSVVILDFARYWVHFADHRVPLLWKFHRVHHCAEYLDSTTGLRMHLVDFIQLSLIPLVLFGLVMDVSSFEAWVIPATMGVGVVFDAFEHSNLRMNSRNPVFRAWDMLFNSPHFHSWHHTIEGKQYDGNYGNTLVIWDRLFGTEVTRPDPPDAYGIVEWDTLEESLAGFWFLRPRNPDAAVPEKYAKAAGGPSGQSPGDK